MRPVSSENQSEDSNDRLVSSLREALRPEPLPPALADCIRADWRSRSGLAYRLKLTPMHLFATAAAAVLMVAVFLQSGSGGRAPQSAVVALSADEAAAIVAAFGTIVWDSPAEYSLDLVSASLDDIEGALRRETGSETVLPWGSDDDWDAPTAIDEGASRGGALQRSLVRATSGRVYRS